MSNLEDVLANQQQILTAIEQIYTNFKKDGADRKTPDYIRRRLDTLDKYWQEFQTNHTALCGVEYAKSHTYFTSNQFEQAKERYDNVRASLANYQGDRPSTPIIKPATPLGMPGTSRQPSPLLSLSQSQGTNSKTDDMLRKQNSNFKAFDHTLSNINLETISEKWEFDHLLRAIQSRWSVIDTLHWELDSELGGRNPEYEATFYRYESKYSDIIKSVNRKLWSVSHREISTPHLEIPVFTGSYHQWSSFKDLFTETIHGNPSLSNAQKMQFIKTKVKGEAERLIQHLPITSDNYPICWDILNHRYNNKSLIFRSHIEILLSIPVTQQISINHIKRIHDTALETLNAIKNLGVNVESWDPLLVHLLSQKLDTETHNNYVASVKQPRELPNLQEFLSFLESKFTSLESSRKKSEHFIKPMQNNVWPQQYQKSNQRNFTKQAFPAYSRSISQQPSNKNSNSTKSSWNYKCGICKTDEHCLYYCRVFLNMSPNIKLHTIAKLNVCENCLYSHNGKQCISLKRCVQCDEPHNSIIHESFTTFNNTTNANTSEPQLSNNSMISETSQQLRNNSHVSVQCDAPEILLATAIIKVQTYDGNYIKLRALVDQGSQVSLITEKAARMLNQPRQKCSAIISGVGSKGSSTKGVIPIKCVAANSKFEFGTDVYIMKNLINNLPNISFPKPPWKYLDNIKLADPEFNVSRPIDLLLGAEIYSLIVLEGICRLGDNIPIAQNTRLGWILTGKAKTLQCNVISNNLENIETAQTNNEEFDFKSLEHTQTLGLGWIPQEDVYTLQSQTESGENNIVTNITLLSDISTLFNPLAWLLPLSTKSKIIFQDVCSANITWDDPIPDYIKSSWQKIKKQKNNHQQENQENTQCINNHSNSTKTTKNFITGAISVLLFFMTLITHTSGLYNITPLQNNTGLFFDKISNMNLIKDDWRLIVYYDLSPYWDGARASSKYIEYLESICLKIKEHSTCDGVLYQLHHDYSELQHYNTLLLDQQFDTRTRRKRRGLINGVGYVANALFGVLDSNFADKYEQDIGLIRKNQGHLAALWKNQSSIVEAEFNLIKRAESVMEKQYKIVNSKLIALKDSFNSVKLELQSNTYLNDFILSAMITNNIMSNLKSIQEYLLDTITDLVHGKFNIHLLSPEQLQNELSVISRQLPKDLALPTDHANLSKLYKLLNVRARLSNKFLIFEIKIPLILRDSFEIMKIIPIRKQSGDKMINIIPISEYIAVNINKDSFLSLVENDLKQCINKDTDAVLCRFSKPIFHLNSDKNLCEKDDKHESCQTGVNNCRDIFEATNKQNTFIYFCCNTCYFKLLCEDQVTAIQLSHTGLLTIGQGCIIKSADFYFYSHKPYSDTINVRPDVGTPDITPLNHLINITLPELPASNSSEIMDRRQLNAIQEQLDIMKGSEPIVDGMSSHDIHHYTVLYVLVAAAAAGGAALCWRRVRRARTARLQAVGPRAAHQCHGEVYSADLQLPSVVQRNRHNSDTENSVELMYAEINKKDRANSPVLFNSSETKL